LIGLLPAKLRNLTLAQFAALSDVPPELEAGEHHQPL